MRWSLSLSIQVNHQQQQRLQAEITASDAKVLSLNAEVERLQVQIEDTTQKVDDERAQLTVLAKALYAQPTSVLVLAAQSRGLDDLLTRTTGLMVAADRAHAAKIRLEADLLGLNAMRDKKQSDLDAEQAAGTLLHEQVEQLQQIQLEAQDLMQQLMQQIADIRRELQAVGGAAPELVASILAGLNTAQLAALTASSQQVWSQVQLWIQLHPQPVAAPLGGSLRLLLPVAGAVLTQTFGPSPYAFEPAYGGFPHFHQGVDLAAPLDTPAVAAYPGVVAVVGSDPWGYGNYVVIAHGSDVTTLSAHLDMALVQPGKVVKAGDVIGLEGSTGNSTGPHVHFELRVKGVPQDPLPYLPSIAAG